MIFLNSLYKVLSSEKTDTGFHWQLEIIHTHTIFKGHFPGAPVLPGIAMLQIIRECVESSFAETITFDYKEIKQCKFPMPIAMEGNRTIQLDFTTQPIDDHLYNLSATMKDDSAIFTTLKATLRNRE